MSDEKVPHNKVSASGEVYHVSKNANAPTAPTNEHTKANVLKQGKMNEGQLDFVTLMAMEYGMNRTLPSSEQLEAKYGIPSETYQVYLNMPLVQTALQERGVDVLKATPVGTLEEFGLKDSQPKDFDSTQWLTPIQLVVANTLLDLSDTRSVKKKLQDLDTDTKVYQSWMLDPRFNNYLRERAENLLDSHQHEAHIALLDQVKAGNLKAIEYFNELNGRFVKQTSNGAGAGLDSSALQNMIIRIVEIITDEVTDPVLGARIAERIQGLIGANQAAGVLPAPSATVIVQPEIAKAPELSAKMQGYVDTGVGVSDV